MEYQWFLSKDACLPSVFLNDCNEVIDANLCGRPDEEERRALIRRTYNTTMRPHPLSQPVSRQRLHSPQTKHRIAVYASPISIVLYKYRALCALGHEMR